jgi:hypothetical protein
MTWVAAGITTSLDGYITGPNDGPGRGLGEGGERLHDLGSSAAPGATTRSRAARPPSRTRSSWTKRPLGLVPSWAAATPTRPPRPGAARTRGAYRSSS